MDDGKTRCPWCLESGLSMEYHDTEWGVPLHDEMKHFEFLTLEGAQAGLSWITILKKRDAYREAYEGFNPEKIARWGETDVLRLLGNPGIVRNRRKIESSIRNARMFLDVQERYGSFDTFIWGFTGGESLVNRPRTLPEVPATSDLSDRVSRELKNLGFSFAGSTIIYAHLQAIGVVNDHLESCFRFRELSSISR